MVDAEHVGAGLAVRGIAQLPAYGRRVVIGVPSAVIHSICSPFVVCGLVSALVPSGGRRALYGACPAPGRRAEHTDHVTFGRHPVARLAGEGLHRIAVQTSL
ncbi:MAG: hypothetical protein ACLFXM_11040 [Acidimicrobiia bacterium]